MTKTAITVHVPGLGAEVPLGEVIAWSGDSLVITAPELVDRVRRPALSPSTAKSMEGCPSRWLGERIIEGEPDPFGPAEIGTAGHSVMEELYELPAHMRTPQAAMGILIKHSKKMWPDDPTKTKAEREAVSIARAQWIADVNFAYKGLFEIEDPTKVMVRRNEWKMEGVEVNGVPFIGYIDRTDVLDGDNGAAFKVIDYKTGKEQKNIALFGDPHGDQLRLYAAAVEAMDGRMPTEAWVYYTKFAKSKKVALSTTKMRETQYKFKKSWTDLNGYLDNASFSTKTSALCGWCVLVKTCPTAKAEGKEARSLQPSITDLGIPVLRAFGAPDPALVDVNQVEPAEETISEHDFNPDDPSLIALDAKELGVEATEPAVVVETPAEKPATVPAALEEPADDWDVPAPENDPPNTVLDPVLDTGKPDDPWGSEFDSAPAKKVTEPVLEPATAAVTTSRSTTGSEPRSDAEKENTMSGLLQEGKPWEARSSNGRLNPTSYSAMGVFGIVELAVESLHAAEQAVTPAKVTALAGTFALVISNAQKSLTGSIDPQEGANTRMRGALRTVIKTVPIPFGKTDEEWAKWVDQATRRCISIANAAVALFENGIDEERPWGALV